VCRSLQQVVAAARSVVSGLEAGALSAGELRAAYTAFAELEKLVAAGQVLLAGRLKASTDWRGEARRSAEEWMARTAGVSVGEARKVAETAERLAGLEATAGKLRAGELSLDQVAAVAEAASVDPSVEAGLLETASAEPVRSLRDKARRVVLEGQGSVEERYARQRRLRSFRHWTDAEGMVAGRFRLTPDAGAAVVRAIGREADRHYRRAYREGRRESAEACAADALVGLVTGEGLLGARSGRGAEVVVMVSHEALRRGFADPEAGELCEVLGFGAVPVSRVRELLADAFLKGVVVDGKQVTKVRHFGRHRPAEVDTALVTQAFLTKGRVECVVEGCGRTVGIEWDHAEPFARGGLTSAENLNPMCDYDNQLKARGQVLQKRGRWVRRIRPASAPVPRVPGRAPP
jgi:hypothetical protein